MTSDNKILRKRQEIVSKLTQARIEKGLSQAQLAELVGTQRSNICRIENGGQNLSLDLLIKISSALGKDIDLLLEERQPEMSNVYHLKLYDDILRQVLAPRWDVFHTAYVLHQLKEYERFIADGNDDVRRAYYQQAITKLPVGIPLYDKIVWALPPLLARPLIGLYRKAIQIKG